LSSFNAALISGYRKRLADAATLATEGSVKQPRTDALPPPPPEVLAKALNIGALTIEWLAGDGSDRCYYRLRSPDFDGPLVLMQLSGTDAEALRVGGYDWVNIARLLAERQVFVPKVVATLPDFAALVIEDYGDLMLEGVIFDVAEKSDDAAVRRLYGECFKIVAKFLTIPPDAAAPWCKRSFDAERFAWELGFFMQKYAFPVAHISLSAAEQRQFETEKARLSQTLAENSRYFVHRDFHSRNVMVKGEKLAVIDFQDARLGPAAYDLVSLCFDSYVPFTGTMRGALMANAGKVVRDMVGAEAAADVERLWKPVLLQRQLKAIGSFGFLTLDKQRGDYLKYVDPALRTLEEQDLADERWPFLSTTLLARLRAYLDQAGTTSANTLSGG
jgi:aminoglycoside/choline kinase family phosphotransferase